MKYLWIFLLLLSCSGQNIIYSEVPLEFFFDKWWELEENRFFEEGTCFLLSTEEKKVQVHYPEDSSSSGVEVGVWFLEEDYIFLEDVYDYDISIWLYGACGDYNVIASTDLFREESKLYKCEF
jgi:hypothetical protein